MNQPFCKALFWAVLLLIGFGGGRLRASGDVHVVVLTHDSLTSTKRTLHGTEKVIRREHPEAVFHSFLVTNDDSSRTFIVDSLSRISPNVIVTIGSAATEFAQANFRNTPITFSSVMYPVLSGFVKSMERPGENVTGASLDIPAEVQFKYFKKIVPDLRRLGVLYTSNTAGLIADAKSVAQSLGLTLVPVLVNDVKELPEALDSLSATAQGVWSVADPNLFDPQSTRYILLNMIRKGIPFMGFSRHVVESGALFALDFDYKAIGFQAGAIASRIIRGEHPRNIPVTMADVIWFHYNEKTADYINIRMPEELVAVAKEVYR